MGMIDVLKTGGFLTIFIISIISFSIMFAENNDSDISILSDSRFSDLNTSLRIDEQGLQGDSITSTDILFKTTTEQGDISASTGGQFKVGLSEAGKMTVRGFNTAFDVVFGSGQEFNFIKTTFVAIFGFISGYFVIKAWLGRDPD